MQHLASLMSANSATNLNPPCRDYTSLDLSEVLNDDLDPNNTSSVLNTIVHYYELDELTKIPQLQNLAANYKSLHLNIQSLPAKYEKLKERITALKEKKVVFDFILLYETFLTDQINKLFPIPGYNFVYQNRTNKSRVDMLVDIF